MSLAIWCTRKCKRNHVCWRLKRYQSSYVDFQKITRFILITTTLFFAGLPHAIQGEISRAEIRAEKEVGDYRCGRISELGGEDGWLPVSNTTFHILLTPYTGQPNMIGEMDPVRCWLVRWKYASVWEYIQGYCIWMKRRRRGTYMVERNEETDHGCFIVNTPFVVPIGITPGD